MNKTVVGVITFIIVLIFAGYSAKSQSEEMFHLGLGTSTFNSSGKVGELGYEVNDWEFQATLIEADQTKNGFQDQLEVYSVSHLIKPRWSYKNNGFYMRLGVSGNSGSNLVGDTNFRLGLGVDFSKVFRLEYSHHSSAGIHQTNTGIDYITLNYQFKPFWR